MTRYVAVILVVSLLILIGIEWLFAHPHHPVFPWHQWPGFLALLGLVSCIVVVKLSKWMGKLFLQRPEVPHD